MNEPTAQSAIGEELPVMVMAARRSAPGRRADFESILRELTRVATGFDGHQGVTVLRPETDSDPYRVLFRFRCQADLDRWDRSSERRSCMDALELVADGPADYTLRTGLESFIDVPDAVAQPPS